MDINLFRDEKEAERIRESQRRRFKPVAVVDEIIALDAEWRKLIFETNQLNKESNSIQNTIKEKKKKNQDATSEIEHYKEVSNQAALMVEKTKEKLKERDEKLYTVGNFVHDSVPVSQDEAKNLEVKKWGDCRPTTPSLHHHHEILYMLDGYETEIGSRVAGHRGYYLKGIGLLLNQALVNYGLQFLHSKGYIPIQTPFFMKKSTMAKVASLAEFDESLYKVSGGDDEDKYLIATSEQPCCALHMNTTVNPKSLPIKYVGYSTCFRKEAGSHGKDVWGIFRVHQFEKIEQFVLCAPDKSWEMHEEMIAVSEEFYRSLELPYHVVSIVSGELNNAASKKYDLEAWFPALGAYRELVSCSNCTDYQARRLDIKYGSNKVNDSIPYVHMLNSTLTATERTICCILENYQTEKGIRIPEVLKPFILPFVKTIEGDVVPFQKGPPPLGKGAKGGGAGEGGAAGGKEKKNKEQKEKVKNK